MDPLEAATAQKIFADPKVIAKIRSSQNPVEKAPGMIGTAIDKISEFDMVKFNPVIKRWLAANPNALEDTQFKPISRAITGGLRQAASGDRAIGALSAFGEGVSSVASPLFRVFEEQKQPTYVSGQ